MKLLQISENFSININKILYIEEEDDTSCWIRALGYEHKLFCDRYSAQELVNYINNDYVDTDESYYDYIVDKLNHILWRIIKNGDNGICKEDK